jgi:uncharacterized membrane protein YcaP (DUF421 family)
MNKLTQVDWQTIFDLDLPVLDLFIRGTIMYFLLFALIQMMNRKQAGKISNSNFLLIVLIADVSQNAISGNYTSLSAGIVLVFTVFFWSYIINLLMFKFSFIENIFTPPPLPLISNGHLERENMKKSLVTKEELQRQMRIEGITSIDQIKKAYIEPDGNISFIRKSQVQTS